MKIVLRYWVRFQSLRGQTMGEYVLIVGAIAMIAYGAYQFLGNQISTATTNIAAGI